MSQIVFYQKQLSKLFPSVLTIFPLLIYFVTAFHIADTFSKTVFLFNKPFDAYLWRDYISNLKYLHFYVSISITSIPKRIGVYHACGLRLKSILSSNIIEKPWNFFLKKEE